MKYIYNKSKKNIYLFYKFELRSIFYKSCFFNLHLSNNIRSFFFKKLLRNKRFFFSSIKNRCFFDYNSRYLLKLFKFSRFYFKSCSSNGYLNGITRK